MNVFSQDWLNFRCFLKVKNVNIDRDICCIFINIGLLKISLGTWNLHSMY